MLSFPAIFAAELLSDTLFRHAMREALQAGNDLDPPAGAPLPVAAVKAPSSSPIHVSAEKGLEVVARAQAEWEMGVREPPKKGWERIDHYIRSPGGLGWPSAALQGSNDSAQYKRNGQFEWCGAFAAFCWSSLRRDIRKKRFASTYRLWTWAKGTPRMLTPAEARPGDILVVGKAGVPRGNHITIVRGGVTEQEGAIQQIRTFEGNASGIGIGAGETYEGVVTRARPLEAPDARIYRALYVVRPLREDLA